MVSVNFKAEDIKIRKNEVIIPIPENSLKHLKAVFGTTEDSSYDINVELKIEEIK